MKLANNRIMHSKYIPYLYITASLLIVIIGLYIFWLFISPKYPIVPIISKSTIDINTKDDATDLRDRIQIEKIGIEVPFFTGNESVLQSGAWHRKPENGDPISGGNFVLAAHRFELGLTPSMTRQKSPFYNIGELTIGDKIKIFYKNNWYEYVITKMYKVSPEALYIENRSQDPKLTLYSCTLNGASDGRDVIEAIINN